MSKLADKIRSVTRLSADPIGFGSTKASRSATMILAGMAHDAAAAGELVTRGADIVIVGTPGRPAQASNGASINGVIAGAGIAGKADDEAKTYHESGFDFVVFAPDTASATALLDETAGYVMTLPTDISDNEIRTLEAFRLDAIDIGRLEGPLTVRRQIDLRRIFAMTRKPLMATVNASISVSMLQALRDANVVIVATDAAEDVARLRKTIDALPPRARRRDDDRPTPLVPRATGGAEEGDEDDEELRR